MVVVSISGAPVDLTLIDLPGIIQSTGADDGKAYKVCGAPPEKLRDAGYSKP